MTLCHVNLSHVAATTKVFGCYGHPLDCPYKVNIPTQTTVILHKIHAILLNVNYH